MHCGHCLKLRRLATVHSKMGGERSFVINWSKREATPIRATLSKSPPCDYLCDLALLKPTMSHWSIASYATSSKLDISQDNIDSKTNLNDATSVKRDAVTNDAVSQHLSKGDILNATEAPFLFVAPSKLGLNLKSTWMRGSGAESTSVPADHESRLRKLNDDLLSFAGRVVAVISAKDVKICEVPPVQSSEDTSFAADAHHKKSSNLIDDWAPQTIHISSLPKQYLRLSKARLTGLVVTTAFSGCLMCPEPISAGVVVLCCLGTAGLAASANTFNQFLEVPFDSQMKRTQSRVLVRGELTPLHSVVFGIVAGSAGFATLYFGLNGLTAGLGLLNLVLYSGVYTPMKRISIVNTWVGSVVGALPPLMGWAAASGQLTTGALVLAGLLFAWQFPHFNALSWNLRPDYSRAGYRMMCVTHPDLCTRTTLRYSVVLLGLCSIAAPLTDLTSFMFAIDSIPLNAYFIYLSYKFHKNQDSSSSRKLFRYSLVYLPAVMLLMIISKKSWTDSNMTEPNLQVLRRYLDSGGSRRTY